MLAFALDCNLVVESACCQWLPLNDCCLLQCACSCPILPGTGSLLAGYSLDGSIGLPGIEYFNEPVRLHSLSQAATYPKQAC